MKILHIIPTYKPAYIYGGTITSISLLCENLVAFGGCEVTVLSTTANGKKELPEFKKTPKKVEGVDVFYFPRWTKDHSQFSPALLIWLFKNVKRYEVVHIHSWWNISVLLSTVICILNGKKPILAPRGMLSPFTISGKFKPMFHKLIGSKLLKNTILHATSQQEVDECLSIIPRWEYTNLPNFLDNSILVNSEIKPKLTPKDKERDELNLLFLSRIHKKKGLEILLESLAEVKFDWNLIIAGEGDIDYINQLKKLSYDLTIENKITWIGWVNAEERSVQFKTVDLMVLPSYNENFGNVVIESLAAGTPVLVSRFVGLSEYVTEKKLGWVCDTSVESLRLALEEIHAEKKELERIASTCSEQIYADFEPKSLSKRYLNMYKKYSPALNI